MERAMIVTTNTMPIPNVYKDDVMEDPLAYLDAYNSSYEEEPYNDSRDTSPEMPKAEAKEEPYSYESDAPEHPDATENPEMPEGGDEEYSWPTNGMAGPTAEEYWNPEMTGLEDSKPSSTMHNQMTSAEVAEWLQEPSDQVVFDWYDRPDREDNKKWQRLCRLELRRNYWTGNLGPDF